MLGDAGPTETPSAQTAPVSLPLLAPPPPPPPLLELQLRPNFLRRSTLFERSQFFFASRVPGEGGTSWPAALTAGEAAPSAGVVGEAVPADVSPENLRTNFCGMKREPGLDADAGVGRAKPALGLGVSSMVIGTAVGRDAPGVGVAGDEGKMCSSGNANARRGWRTAIAPALVVLLAVLSWRG